jgi:microsomal dipeptidase-like Zn-dependent dipeptidase
MTTKRRYPESVGAYVRSNVRTIGFETLANWPIVAEHLFKAGYDQAAVAKILGGNWARVFHDVWDGGPVV